jgi:hypothetical protein
MKNPCPLACGKHGIEYHDMKNLERVQSTERRFPELQYAGEKKNKKSSP